MKHLPLSSLAAINATPIPVRYLVEGKCDPAVYSSFDSLVSDIAAGQVEYVETVLEIFEDEGSVRNVSEDVARAVKSHIAHNHLTMIDGVRGFIHEQLGVFSC